MAMFSGRMGKAALLLGIPVTYEEFALQVSRSDWLAKFNDPELSEAERASSLRTRWDSEYLPFVAEPLQELIKNATRLKVAVCCKATLTTLTEVTSTCQLVILF